MLDELDYAGPPCRETRPLFPHASCHVRRSLRTRVINKTSATQLYLLRTFIVRLNCDLLDKACSCPGFGIFECSIFRVFPRCWNDLRVYARSNSVIYSSIPLLLALRVEVILQSSIAMQRYFPLGIVTSLS